MITFFEWPQVEPLSAKDHGVPLQGSLAFDHIAFEVVADDDLGTLKQSTKRLTIKWIAFKH